MDIRIGNQTAFSALSPLAPFEYAVACSFNAFEWFPDRKGPDMGWDEDSIDLETREQIKEAAMEHDMALSVHAPWQANPFTRGAMELVSKSVTFALDIGASLLNIHLHTEEGIGGYVKAVRPIINLTAEAGLKLSIENTVLTGPEEFNELFRTLAKLKDIWTGHVGMCLDIGHANLYAQTNNDYLKFVDRLDSKVPIIHLHMHENYGGFDSHMTLFTGPSGKNPAGIVGFMERMQKRNFSGSIILEQWPQTPFLLNEARKKLYQIIDSTQQNS